MTTLVVETVIAAPPDVCFDLARDIDFHCHSAAKTHERAIAPGRTSGLIHLNERVVFEGTHFGVQQRLSAIVTEFDRPKRFVDTMDSGAFSALQHVHEFFPGANGQTLMRDTLIWTAPWGVLGQVADVLFLRRHMKRFLQARNAHLKVAAESKASAN